MTDDPEHLRVRPAPGTRAPAHPAITEAHIGALVDTFYDAVWSDARLGPIFSGRIADRDAHLATMKLFWSSVLLKSGTYHGRPVPAHIKLSEVQEHDFPRWLALFREACHRTFDPEPAAVVIQAAESIARSLWLAMSSTPQQLKPQWG